MGYIVKIDRHEGPMPKGFESSHKNGWKIGKFSALVYVSHDPGALLAYFRDFTDFKVFTPDYVDLKDDPEKQGALSISVGRYRGKSELHDGTKMQHLQEVYYKRKGEIFKEGSLEVGPAGHKVSFGDAFNTTSKVLRTMFTPEGIGEGIVKVAIAAKYFVAFSVREQEDMMHGQEDIVYLINDKPCITLCQFYAWHGRVAGEHLYKMRNAVVNG